MLWSRDVKKYTGQTHIRNIQLSDVLLILKLVTYVDKGIVCTESQL